MNRTWYKIDYLDLVFLTAEVLKIKKKRQKSFFPHVISKTVKSNSLKNIVENKYKKKSQLSEVISSFFCIEYYIDGYAK